MCTVTLTLEIWPWIKVLTHPWVMDNNCVKYYPDPTWQWGVMAPTRISSMCALWPWPWVKVLTHPWVMDNNCVKYYPNPNLTVRSYGPDTDFQYVCTVTLTLEIWPWVKVMTHPWVMDNNCVKYYPDPTWQWGVMARTRISSMCALWPWPWRYDLGSKSWHTLGLWTTIVWNIIQIQLGSEEFWPRHGFPVCVHCHGQQLCEILSRSDKGVRSYGPDTMWTNGQTEGQTDGQTDGQGDSYILHPKLCLRGGGV